MTYNPNEPQDLPPPVVATTQIRTNFAQFQTVFTTNHTNLNTSNQGKHDRVIFQEQSTDPVIDSDFVAMYAKEIVAVSTTQPQIFIRVPQFLPNNVNNFPEQITFNVVNTAGPQYQTFLPGGYIMHFGSVSVVPTTITLTPVSLGIVSVVVNANNMTTAGVPIPVDAYATILNANQFTINSAFVSGVYSFTWVAICKQ